jgi:hypothetical protein
LVLKLRIARLLALNRDGEKLEARLIGIPDALSNIQNIPAMDKQAELLADLRCPEYYLTLGQADLDHVSTAIRDLLVYLTQGAVDSGLHQLYGL